MQNLTEDELYALLHTGNPSDAEFYCRMSEAGARVLEIGCGWGRIASALAEGGAQVTGIDINASFIARAREDFHGSEGLQFLCADARSPWPLSPEARFDRVLLPYNTAYALGGPQAFSQVLAQARTYLTETGMLYFDVYSMDDLHEHLVLGGEPEEDDDEPVAHLETPYGALQVFELTEFAVDEQRLDVTYEAVDTEGTVRGRLNLQHHYLTTTQMESALSAHGFARAGRHEGFLSALGRHASALEQDGQSEQVIFCARPC